VTPRFDRILLLDDSEPDNVYHEIVLRRAGFDGDLQIFDRAELALRYLQELPDGPVCLVLLDINMPGMDGWQFIEAAGPLLAGKATIVLVMLTSSPAREDRERALGCVPVQGYVTKPLNLEKARALLAGDWPGA
jgi:CheY-like chemotaxis protein